MRAAGFIVVRNEDHISAAQEFVVTSVPFTGTARICRRGEIQSHQSVDVFFAFGDYDRPLVGDGFEQDRKPIQYPAYTLQIPCPAAAVRPALSESFRHEPANLEQQIAALIDVVVRCDRVAERRCVMPVYKSLLTQPCDRLAIGQAARVLDKIERTAADVFFVVEPGALNRLTDFEPFVPQRNSPGF
jgi:hypothetical protein